MGIEPTHISVTDLKTVSLTTRTRLLGSVSRASAQNLQTKGLEPSHISVLVPETNSLTTRTRLLSCGFDPSHRGLFIGFVV